jgi:type III pantothenate kinase
MLLVVDAGNSHTVLGLYAGDELRAHWRVVTNEHRTADELSALFATLFLHRGYDPRGVRGCCISSVVPPINRALLESARATFAVEPLLVEPGVKTGIVIQVENPKEVGADRIANAVAAAETYEGPLIVIDFGTATTFDVVSARAEYKGGVIVPGIEISAKALFEHCAKLPHVDIVRPSSVIGRSTVAHICSGLTYGYADLVDGLILRISREMGEQPTVVATGGFSELIAGICQRVHHVDPHLTLRGLKSIYERNEGPVP